MKAINFARIKQFSQLHKPVSHLRGSTNIGVNSLKYTPSFSKANIFVPFSNGFMRRLFSTTADKIRNIAIIAHVDHGKTTMVDAMLSQSGALKNATNERVMDSNQLEKERGITILAKQTAFKWGEYKVNLVDTPGHGDFGGEVERILSMVDGVILIVDGSEGVMAQTKFVLSKALKAKLKPIVVLNKMDRKEKVRTAEVENEIFDLFCNLEATNEQMDYPTLYASAREGWVVKNLDDEKVDLKPLFEAIIKHAPAPKINAGDGFSMLVTNIESDDYLGRIVSGKIVSGNVKINNKMKVINREGKLMEEGSIKKVISRFGLDKMYIDEASAGDIVGLSGFNLATVTCTIRDSESSSLQPIECNPIDPPVLSISMTVNNSPLSGKEGSSVTFPQIKRRLEKELESNVAINVVFSANSDEATIYGRGEMQLGILLENMRREGFEFTISPPKVVFKYDDSKSPLEPLEEVIIDVDDEYVGLIMQKLSSRMGELTEMKQIGGKSRLMFLCPSRTLLGLRQELLTETRGSAVFNHLFHSYIPYKGSIEGYKKGHLVSIAEGVTTNYALLALEARGTLFVTPGVKVYPGMIIGESSREGDLEVNPVRTKHVTNVRAVSKEETVKLSPPRVFTLEEAITYIRDKQVLEITPKTLRFRRTEKK